MKKIVLLIVSLAAAALVLVSSVSGEANSRVFDQDVVTTFPPVVGANGKVQIIDAPLQEYKWMRPLLKYSVQGLGCADNGNDRVSPHEWTGKVFYTVLLKVGAGEFQRIQTFNPGCYDQPYSSMIWLSDYTADELLNESIYVEIHLGYDNGYNSIPGSPATLMMQGEDISN